MSLSRKDILNKYKNSVLANNDNDRYETIIKEIKEIDLDDEKEFDDGDRKISLEIIDSESYYWLNVKVLSEAKNIKPGDIYTLKIYDDEISLIFSAFGKVGVNLEDDEVGSKRNTVSDYIDEEDSLSLLFKYSERELESFNNGISELYVFMKGHISGYKSILRKSDIKIYNKENGNELDISKTIFI